MKENVVNVATGAIAIPTRGASLVDTPTRQYGGRAQLDVGPVVAGVSVKHLGDRFVTSAHSPWDRKPEEFDQLFLQADLCHGIRESGCGLLELRAGESAKHDVGIGLRIEVRIARKVEADQARDGVDTDTDAN